ncbi:membrane fusion protein Use1-domain-containing protein [Amanita rubescens]|nr:membrane fusion protein Use1-domain-containing protein [Amanita rubescens]
MYHSGVHDEVNLARLIRRLEKSVALDEWKNVEENGDTWLKAAGIIQRVKFARKLLRNCESFEDVDEKKSQMFTHWKGKLDHAETTLKEVRDRAKPQPTHLPPILPSLPNPLALPTEKLLLSPSDTTPLPSANIPSAIPTYISSNFPPGSARLPDTAAVATGASRFLQTSNALHQDLSEQLAQMAVQLKRNALHFSETLEKDKAIVEEAQQKVESNFDVMKTERIRLRDHRGKSGSTTCLVVAIILAVVLLFVMMVLLIRLTRTI